MAAAGTDRVGRLPRMTLSGQIAGRLREHILSGDFPRGAQLNEAELAERFGVSRGPLREAMQRLIQEGLLTSEPHRGVFVPSLTDDDLIEIYFLREVLEAAAIRRAVRPDRRAGLIVALDAVVTAMRRALEDEDWRRLADLDLDFHAALVAAAGSPRLSRMQATLAAETRLCLHLVMGGYRSNRALVDEHAELARLIGAGEAEAAVAELARQFANPVAWLKKAESRRRATS